MVDFALVTAGVASAINPRETVMITPSTGPSAPNTAAQRTPTFGTPRNAQAQFQRLSYNDLQQIESSGINIQGARFKIIVHGPIDGINRSTGQGGDLVTRIRVDQTVWKCVLVLDRFYGTHGEVRWTSAVVTQQDAAPVFQNN